MIAGHVGKVLVQNLHYGPRPPTHVKATFQHIYQNRGLGAVVTWPTFNGVPQEKGSTTKHRWV